jgi:hypothetical protein
MQNKKNKIIKDKKISNINNSNRNIDIDFLNSKKNLNHNNYIKIVNNDKKKINLINNKIIPIEKERTSSLIPRQKNNKINNNNNIENNSSNYYNFVKLRLKSKNNISSSNNKSAIGGNLKRIKKNSIGGSRNHSKGLYKHFNKSFNESLIDKKYLSTMVNIEKNTDKNNLENNQSSILKTQGNDKLDISNDYMIINKKTDAKENKGNKKVIKNFELSGHKYIYNRNHYNTINSENTNYKAKINNKSNNSTGKRKIYNRKHEKGFNSNKFVV